MKRREALDWIAFFGFVAVAITFVIMLMHFAFEYVRTML